MQWENAKEQCQALGHSVQLLQASAGLNLTSRNLEQNEEPRDPDAAPRDTLDLLAADVSREDPDWASTESYAQLEAIGRRTSALDPEEDHHVLETKVLQIWYRILYHRLSLEDEHNIQHPRELTERPELTDGEHQFLERTRTDHSEQYAEAEHFVKQYQIHQDPRSLEPNEHRELIEQQRGILNSLILFTISRVITRLAEFGVVVQGRQREPARRETTGDASHEGGDAT